MNRRALACAAALLFALAGCGGGAAKPDGSPAPTATPNPTDIADLATFRAHPTDATYEALHSDIITYGYVDGISWRLVDTLMAVDVTPNVLTRAGADLSSVDFVGSLAYLRQLNVSAQAYGASRGDIVRKTAELTWIVLAFRGFGDKTALNLSRMDLRTPNPVAVHAMDLGFIDFSGDILPSGTWRDVNLSDASFKDARSDGPITCENCTWGSASGTLQFSNGRWIAP
ncbi:MAG: hypothetical protein JO199_05150 [Candidatus Eremiobacteraeota bacterium]|nr:hypothetical protein [Candidatus Eremiobacteraeota bacterium]